MSFGAVVLNYNDYFSTLKCVDSLLSCCPPPKAIVVVDNHSPNESYIILKKALAKYKLVDVIDSGYNGGYSYGNNVGIRRMLDIGIKHVVLATSDTEIVSKHIFKEFQNVITPQIGLIGPRIISPTGEQNPPVESLTLKYILDLMWIQYGMPGARLRAILVSCFKRHFFPRCFSNSNADCLDAPPSRCVYMLHGAFICLTNSFLHRVGLLDERIFMFGEENLLAWRCETASLCRLFLKNVKVIHHDDSSVIMTYGNTANAFIHKAQKYSGHILKQEIPLMVLFKKWLHQRIDGRNTYSTLY